MPSAPSSKMGADNVVLLDARRRRAETDAAMLEGIARGDNQAAEALYDRFGSLINRLVWRLLGADQEHNDVVHQVFLAIIGSASKVKDVAALEGWVASVTVNTVRKEIARRRVRRIVGFAPPAEMDRCAGHRASPATQATVQRLYRAMGQMKAEHRVLFALRFIEGYRLDECARLRGCSLATVKRRLRHARDEFDAIARGDSVLAGYLAEADDG